MRATFPNSPGVGLAVLALIAVPTESLPARAERIENKVAVFSALDKVTAHISRFEVELNKTAVFGSLKITPRICYSRPPTEPPKTTTFVEVDEVQLDGKEKRIFTGWMFAESPGIFGVEHPTLDVWLSECQGPLKATAQRAPEPGETKAEPKLGDAKSDAKSKGTAAAKPAEAQTPAAKSVEPAEAPAGELPRRRRPAGR